MDVSTAIDLIKWEACIEDGNGDGMLVLVRSGMSPEPERVETLLKAFDVLRGSLKESGSIDRKLAYALHVLAMEIIGQSDATVPSVNWTKQFMEKDRWRLMNAAEKALFDFEETP